MTVMVRMRGELEAIPLSGDFADTLTSFNIAAAKGLEFAIAEDPSGRPVGIAMRNINTIREVEDDDDAFLG